jgi:hypothetical protein
MSAHEFFESDKSTSPIVPAKNGERGRIDTNGLDYYKEPDKERYVPGVHTDRDSGTEVDLGPDVNALDQELSELVRQP